MNSGNGLRVQIWLAASALLVVALLAVTHNELSAQAEAAEDLERDRVHIELTVRLLAQIQAAESDALAYALLGDRSAREAFEGSAAAARNTAAALQPILMSWEESEGEALPMLRGLVESELARLDAFIDARRDGGLDAVRDTLTAGPGPEVGVRLQQTVSAIQARERKQAAGQNRQRTSLLMFVTAGGILALVIVAVSTLVFRRQLGANRRLLAGVEASGREAELKHLFGQRLQVCRDLEEAARVVACSAGQLFPGSAGAVFLIHPSRNAMQVYCEWGGSGHYESGQLFYPHDCWALRQGRIHTMDTGETELACAHLQGATFAFACCVPMLAQGESLGILSVEMSAEALGSDGRRDTNREKRLIETVAAQVATAIGSLRMRESLRTQSVRDPLTGLFNRRYLEETVDREQVHARRSGRPLSVILLDLDHFKQFNDTHGHQAGDHLLKTLGGFLRREIRGSDIACRYGGEEFVLVLPGASHAEALPRAEEIRGGIGNLEVRIGGHTLGPVTASFGVATFPDAGDNWQDAIELADKRLYRAKELGRDCVVGAPDCMTPQGGFGGV